MASPYRVKDYGKKSGGPLRSSKDSRHGTQGGYFYWGCRCGRCTAAATKYSQDYRKRRSEKIKPEDHGKATTYTNSLCRCDPCREAYRVDRAGRKRNRTDRGTKINLSDLA